MQRMLGARLRARTENPDRQFVHVLAVFLVLENESNIEDEDENNDEDDAQDRFSANAFRFLQVLGVRDRANDD